MSANKCSTSPHQQNRSRRTHVTIDTAKRNWLEESGSDDSHGRALWALGTGLGRSNTPTLHNKAARIFQQSLLAILETTNPRAWAFALIGIHEYLGRFAGDRRVSQVQEELAGRLVGCEQNRSLPSSD